MQQKVITRFAPSNTGLIHLGNLRTCLFSYFLAKENEGIFYLRIDDTDPKRSCEKYSREIKNILDIFEMSNDGVYYQSERKEIYDCALQQLIKSKDVYKDGDVYKFKIDNSNLSYYDELLKKEIFINKKIDDVIVQRSDGSYLFNFCCAVDDSIMRISHVIRGSDHINNTIIQLQIIKKLCFTAHIPKYISSLGLIKELSLDGLKFKPMSKRDRSSSVRYFLEKGYYPEAILNCIARLGCSFGTDELLPKRELSEKFNLNNLNSNSGIFDLNKLNSYQSECIKNESIQNLYNQYAKINLNVLFKGYSNGYMEYDEETIKAILELYKKEIITLEGLGFIHYIFAKNWIIPKNIIKSISCSVIEKTLYCLEEYSDEYIIQNTINLKKLVKDIASELKLTSKEVYLDLRKCLTGNDTSPDLQRILNILGIEEVLKRLKNCNDYFYEVC